MLVARSMSPSNTFVTAEIRLIDCEDNSSSDMLGRGLNDEQNVIAAVDYKQTVDKKIYMEQHHTVEKTDRKILKHICNDEAHLCDEYPSYGEEILTRLSESQSMCDGLFGWIIPANH